jgi:4-amino-4-deoxy-L-arabinose transferase-like glycosyltransferase
MPPARRRIRPDTYLFFYFGFAFILLLTHALYFDLPFFWDELGQFVPAALDLFRSGAWVPRTTVPNVHPPGVMAYLAGFWLLSGYSVEATRIAMLLLASAGLLAAFLLAIELGREDRGAPALYAVALLCVSPLFFAQSMMAQLDMPAMVFTALALLFFVQDRPLASAAVSAPLVLMKETGAVAPLLFAAWLIREKRPRDAAWFLIPLAALALWLGYLTHTTGNLFGNQEFTRYNLFYQLHPFRLMVAFGRRLYFVFFEDFRWVGTVALVWAWRAGGMFRSRAWRVSAALVAAYLALLSVVGGAVLERYLLPVFPVLFAAMAAALARAAPAPRSIAQVLLAGGLAAGNIWNPPYPFPFENNLAFTDFVRLHAAAARYLERFAGSRTVTTAWPLSAALTRPDFGYVAKRIRVRALKDFTPSSVDALEPGATDIFVLYSRDSEPTWGLFRTPLLADLRSRFYGYQPQISGAYVERRFGLRRVAHWQRGRQWIEIYARDAGVTLSAFTRPNRAR